MDCFEDAELAIETHINNRGPSEPVHPASKDGSPNSAATAPIPHMARLLRADDGKFIFIGDSSNLSLLQNIRKLVEIAVGPCRFTSDPKRYIMVETVPTEHQSYEQRFPRVPADKPEMDETRRLVDHFLWATHGILDVLMEHEQHEQLLHWQGVVEKDFNNPLSAKYFLILAIGAQVGLQERDTIAESYFNTGRCLTAIHHNDCPSLAAVHCHLLIVWYLLGAGRRNAAYTSFGIAVQAAFAIGLHLREVSDLFKLEECTSREHGWRSIRVLDLFLASSLGRPALTSESRRAGDDHHSAALDICNILENVLKQVYTRRAVSSETVADISSQIRKYVSRLAEGITTDGIPALEFLEERNQLNVGLVYIRDGFHINVMLLTRPFLLEAATACVKADQASNNYTTSGQTVSDPNQVLVLACVDSAIQIVEPLRLVCNREPFPKRLPLVVNSVFLAAMVLGLAFFANLDRTIPLDRHLDDALTILRFMGIQDVQAQRNLGIVEYLIEACRKYVDKRDWERTKSRNTMVGGLFGTQQFSPMADKESEALQAMSAQPTTEQTSQLLPPSSTLSSAATNDTMPDQNSRPGQLHIDNLTYAEPPPIDPPSFDGIPRVNFLAEPDISDDMEVYYGTEALLSPQTLIFDVLGDDLPLFTPTTMSL